MNGVRIFVRGQWRHRPETPQEAAAPRSPWQNGYAERLIGSIRRECLDHVVVLGECHLRHLLLSYMTYYNGARTHLSLEKDAPFSRAVERAGQISPRLPQAPLSHCYERKSLDAREARLSRSSMISLAGTGLL
jgi:transposase InsO family protein